MTEQGERRAEPADGEPEDLLVRWQLGDRMALNALLEIHLPWIQQHVNRRLGPLLRRRGDPEDFVNDAVLEILTYAPRFHVQSEALFRGLVARVVENTLRDQHERYTAQRRSLSRERGLPSDSQLLRDPPTSSPTTPSQIVDTNERKAWIRFGTELLSPMDREAVILRSRMHLSFVEIGARLRISPDSARMRFERAMIRLGDLVAQLRRGELQRLPEDPPAGLGNP